MKYPTDQILGGIAGQHLASFASAVGAGWVYGGSPVSALTAFAGDSAAVLLRWLVEMESAGFAPEQIERLIHAVIGGRQRDKALAPYLVVSGPDEPG